MSIFLFDRTDLYCHGWTVKTYKRAVKDHAHKKAVRKQKQHLREVKSKTALRQIVLNSRRKQKR